MRPSPRQLLRDHEAEAILITDPTNVGYLLQHAPIQGSLLAYRGRYHLFTYVPFLHDAAQLEADGVVLRGSEQLKDTLRSISAIVINKIEFNIHEYELLKRKSKNIKYVQKMGIIQDYRRTKDEHELHIMKRADRLTATLMKRAQQALRPGIREEQLARQIQIWALELGADGMAFDPIVAFGQHTASPHHIPTHRPLRTNDIVQLDLGIKLQGYCSDRSDVFFVGKVDEQIGRAYRVVQKAARLVMRAAKKGVKVSDLDTLARQVIGDAGLPDYPYALGHGVGLSVHEAPRLSAASPDVLQSCEVIAVEPGVYVAGAYGLRWERTVVIS